MTRYLRVVAAISILGCGTNQLGNLEASDVGNMTLGPAPRGAVDAEVSAACGDGGRTGAGGDIDRAPYLQSVGADRASLLWTARDGAHADVALWRAGSTDEVVVEPSIDPTTELTGEQQWIAPVADLEPDTIYCYELRDGDAAVVAATGFRTAPPTASDATVSLVAVGDLGQATPDQFAVAEQIQNTPHQLALLTGDVAYESGTLASFEAYYFDVYAPYIDNIPVFPADGNHDYQTRQAGPFREVFALPENGGNEFWYSFDWGNVHVAVLDTEQVGAEQADWLDADLERTEQPWKIVIGHRPPYSSGYHGSSSSVREWFEPIFQRHGVQLTVWGHDHDYERTRSITGVTYVVTGGGGVGTRGVGQSAFTAFSQEVSHFVLLETAGDELHLWAVDATGQTFDTAVIPQRSEEIAR